MFWAIFISLFIFIIVGRYLLFWAIFIYLGKYLYVDLILSCIGIFNILGIFFFLLYWQIFYISVNRPIYRRSLCLYILGYFLPFYIAPYITQCLRGLTLWMSCKHCPLVDRKLICSGRVCVRRGLKRVPEGRFCHRFSSETFSFIILLKWGKKVLLVRHEDILAE